MLGMIPREPDDIDYERLARYFAGECTAAEIAAIRAWIAADQARRRLVEQLQSGWAAADPAELRGDVDRGWAALAARLDEAPSEASRTGRPPRVLRLQPPSALDRTPWRAVRFAAAILLAVGLGALVSRGLGKRPSSDQLAAARDTVTRVVTTRSGQQANVYLSDGTHVILGVASTLRFPTAFGASRDVALEGEAFFEVVHEAARTFRVHTRYGVARDLGTKFDVRAYRGLPSATITVTEGSVVVTANRHGASQPSAPGGRAQSPAGDTSAAPDSLIVIAAQVASASADGVLRVGPDSAAGDRLAWMSGRLVFDQMPVGEAVDQLNRWYGTDVQLGDSSLARLQLTASLGEEPFDRAIQVVARALDARIGRHGDSIILYSQTAGR